MNRWLVIIPAGTITLILLLLGLLMWTSQESFVRSPETGQAVGDESTSNAKDKAKARAKKSRNKLPNGRLRMSKPYVVIDRYANMLYYRTEDSVLLSANCSTGSGAELVDTLTGRHWKFDTPVGVFVADSKLEGPWWRKPDWAFIEEGESLPLTDEERMDPYVMGEYAIGFGDGFFIHGTLYERLLGVSVTHGCVRLGEQDLEYLYGRVHYGTYIFAY